MILKENHISMDQCCSDLQVDMVKIADLSLAYNKDHGQLEQK